MKNVLFVCSKNQWRSPTAEQVFANYPGIQVASAGLSIEADNLLTPDLLVWADIVFVMERMHRTKLQQKFKPWLKDQSIICLDIADDYGYMNLDLVALLKAKVPRYL